MSPRTTVVLLLLVGVLAVLIWRQTEREDPNLGVQVVPLLEGLDTRRVTKLRVDNLERSLHMGLERDSGGRWFLVDPVAYPARPAMVDKLLAALRNDAFRVSAAELKAADTGLDPPRIVVEATEEMPGGAERQRTVEVGNEDLDGLRLYVRSEGQVRRTMRNIETSLELYVDDWRSRAVFELDPRTILEIDRGGAFYDSGVAEPLDFRAERRGASWLADRPARFHGDPLAMSSWAAGLANLAVERFVSDEESPDLTRFGLDAPWLRLRLVDRNSNEQSVLFAGKRGRIYAKREDLPNVWTIEDRDVQTLRQDPRVLFESHLATVFRHDVDELRVHGQEHVLRFLQDKAAKRWTVTYRSQGTDGAWTLERPANADVVDRVLSTFEQTEIVDYLWEEPVSDWFPEGAPRVGLWLEAGGLTHGGRLGPVHRTAGGTETRTFLRDGEDVVALLPLAVAELLDVDPLAAESLLLVELNEPRLRFLEIWLEGGASRREFNRSVQGTWVYRDTPDLEAREILEILDQLVYLLADRHVPVAEAEELSGVVAVRLRGEEEVLLEVGVTAAGEVRARIGARQSVLRSPDVHARLLEIASKAR